MTNIDDLVSEVKSLQNVVNNNSEPKEEPTEPVVEIPEKKWYQFGDWFSRQDELQVAILKALQALEKPVEPPPEEPPSIAPSPSGPSPVTPSPPPMFPSGIEPKLDSLISEQSQTKTLLEGFGFKTNQDTIVATGIAQQAIHQFRTYFLIVRADTGNTSDITIGPKGVTTATGYNIGAGESIGLTIDVLKNGLYIVGTTGDSISWIALV